MHIQSQCEKCGYKLIGRASALPAYCAACGDLLREAPPTSAAAKLSALVVDDSKMVRVSVCKVLGELGCRAHAATNGQVALDQLEEVQPDLVITDLMMPEMDGVEFLTELRKLPSYTETPVVILSAIDSEDILRKVSPLGVMAYVLKESAKPGDLRQRLGQCVQGAAKIKSRRLKVDVLVVEDSSLRKALAGMLEKLGCSVREAGHGKQALAAILERRPDLVISDIEMPEMDGLTLLRTLRDDDACRDLPVVMLTSRTEAKIMNEAMQAGVIAYLCKDHLSAQDLRRQLEQCLLVVTPQG